MNLRYFKLTISLLLISMLGIGSKENSTEAYRPTLTFATIPEPGSMVLMLIGTAGLLIFRRRK